MPWLIPMGLEVPCHLLVLGPCSPGTGGHPLLPRFLFRSEVAAFAQGASVGRAVALGGYGLAWFVLACPQGLKTRVRKCPKSERAALQKCLDRSGRGGAEQGDSGTRQLRCSTGGSAAAWSTPGHHTAGFVVWKAGVWAGVELTASAPCSSRAAAGSAPRNSGEWCLKDNPPFPQPPPDESQWEQSPSSAMVVVVEIRSFSPWQRLRMMMMM